MKVKWYNFIYSSTEPVDETTDLINQSGIFLLAGEHVKLEREIEDYGRIFSIIIHFPPGVNKTVLVRLFRNTEQIFPDIGFFAASDLSMQIPIHIVVSKGDRIGLEAVNTDVLPHSFSLLVGIECSE